MKPAEPSPEVTGADIAITRGRIRLRGALTSKAEADELMQAIAALRDVLWADEALEPSTDEEPRP